MRSVRLIAVLALASTDAFAATPVVEQFTQQLPIEATGTVWLNNAYGSIDVTGTDDDKITITIQRQITASDDPSLREAKQALLFGFERDTPPPPAKTPPPQPPHPPSLSAC